MQPNNENVNTLNRDNMPYIIQEAFHTFKINGKRKNFNNNSYHFIIKNEWNHKKSTLQKEVESITKRLYELSNSSNLFNGFILTNFNINLKSYLTHKQLEIYNRCLDYIKTNNLPNYYSYYIIDFLASTEDKFINSNEENIFYNIAVQYILNTKSILSGDSCPKYQNTIYNTLPKAFSPLFFEKIQFASTILRNKKLRKDFENCLNLAFIDQIKKSTGKLLQSNNQQEIYYIVNQTLHNIQNQLWAPEMILTKLNRMKIYVNNLFNDSSIFLEYVMLSYLCYLSDYGLEQDKLKQYSSTKIFESMKKHIKFILQKADNEPKNGWSIFDSVQQKDGYAFDVLSNLYCKLSKQLSNTKVLKLNKNYSTKNLKIVDRICSNTFIA